MNLNQHHATAAALVALLMICAGCARLPTEAIVLSDTIGKDLSEIQSAHTGLVRRHFASMRDQADAFVDEVYRPFIIRKTMDDLNLVEEIQAAALGESDLDPLDIMEIYADEALAQIGSFRKELLQPINQQEQALLSELDASYGRLRNANAVLTAHLRSVRDVHESQAELLSDIGVAKDLRQQLSGRIADFSAEFNKLLLEARSAGDNLDQLPDRIRELRDRS